MSFPCGSTELESVGRMCNETFLHADEDNGEENCKILIYDECNMLVSPGTSE